MELIDIDSLSDVVNLAAAVLVTNVLTEFGKRSLKAYGVEYGKLAPLLALLFASIAVAVVIDREAATLADYALAVVLTAGTSIGIFSGTKNVREAVQAYRRERRHEPT